MYGVAHSKIDMSLQQRHPSSDLIPIKDRGIAPTLRYEPPLGAVDMRLLAKSET